MRLLRADGAFSTYTYKRPWWHRLLAFLVLYMLFVGVTGSYTLYQTLSRAQAAGSPWVQTDWSGGVGASATTQYSAATDIKHTTAGQISLSARSGWYNEDWLYRKKVTFNNSAQAQNLTDFVVLVKLTGGVDIDYTKTQNSGQDIRFTDSDGTTLLDYEIETWNEAGDSIVWVRVPQIDASSATDHIYMYYGNTGAVDAQNTDGTWATAYKSVYHMNNDPAGTAPQIQDRSGNTNNGTTAGTMLVGDLQAGQIGDSVNFDGVNDRVAIGTMPALAGSGSLTMESWFFQDTTPGGYRGIMGQIVGGNAWYIHTSNTANQRILVGIGNTVNSCGINTGYVGAWTHLMVVFDGAGATNADKLKIYVNGVHQAATCAGTFPTTVPDVTTNQAVLADLLAFNRYFDGRLDEMRISTQAKSAAVVAAEYLSQTDAYASYGTEEIRYVAGTLTSNIFDGFAAGNVWGQLDYLASGAGTIGIKVRTSNSATMSGAPAFATCTAIANNSDISGNGCVTDSHRYVQYEVTLTPTAAALSPIFEDFSLAFVSTNNAPNTPTGTTPVHLATDVLRNPTLVASAYSDPELDAHADTEWQVDNNSDFSSPDWTRTSGGAEVTTLVSSANGTFANSLSGKLKLASATQYHWRMRYNDGATWSSYSSTMTFTTNNIVTPVNSSPGNAQVATSSAPTLVASAFADEEAGTTHLSSQWQVDDAVDFITPLHDSGEVAAGVSYTVPDGLLNNFINYYWRVRYKNSDGEWSAYSTHTSFTINSTMGSVLLQPVGWNQTYSIGDTASFTLQTLSRDSGGAFVPDTADSSPSYRIRYWDGATWVELVASSSMSPLAATATYQATYAIPSDSAWIGRRVAVIFSATINGIQETISREIEIVGSPAQVLITSMGSVTVPNITANVLITNEGTAAFEYLYEYCVVMVSTNLCGGGDDVAYGSAAKLIAAGDNFATTLGLTVATPGAYYFKVTVWWSAQSSVAQLGFAAASSTPSSASSGGGSAPPAVVSPPVIAPSTGLLADVFRKNAEIVARLTGYDERLAGLDQRIAQLEQRSAAPAPVYLTPAPVRVAPKAVRIRFE